MPVPPFRADGYLPEGVHVYSEGEVFDRFGASTLRRKRLCGRLRRWLQLGRAVGARRLLIDGSFVTAKAAPADVDAVLQLGPGFDKLVDGGDESAAELFEMLTTREPEELFAAEDDRDWADWVDFFSRTREPSGVRKGLVEILL